MIRSNQNLFRVFPTRVSPALISYVRLLLDDTNPNADQHRIKIVDSAACDCGDDMETNYHYVMECVLYGLERNTMISNLQQM